MITCSKVEDPSVVLHYLRRDVLPNIGLLLSLERNIPPVQREVWAAKQADGMTVGVMLLEQFPHGPAANVRATSPQVLLALVRCLKSDQKHNFAALQTSWRHLEAELTDMTPPSETISMTVSPHDLRFCSSPGRIRPLSSADRHLADRFPAPDRQGEPPLSRFMEWTEKDAEQSALFGVLMEGEIASFVIFRHEIDNIWSVHMIRTRDEYRRKGFAKAVLSHASRQLLQQGIVPLYEVRSDNLASLRTAEAVGYRQVFRVVACEAYVRTGGS